MDGASTRALKAAAMFGLRLSDAAAIPPGVAAGPSIAAQIDRRLGAGETCLLTGASGGGKSSALARLAERLGESAVVARPAPALAELDERLIDLMRSPPARAMRLLAGAGLGEAGAFLRRASELSDGERFRLSLALAMETAATRRRSGRVITVIVDEFASTLDRAGAACVARTASRWAEAWGVRLVVATAHDDLGAALVASLVGTFHLGAPPALAAGPGPRPDVLHDRIEVRRGTPADYAALSRWHYRAGRPATCVRVLAAVDRETGGTVGVLTVSMPTLNSAVRPLAWPGRYGTGDKRADAARLNAEVRTISRVIVDPRWRGVGLASRLVRGYLASPLTPATEAIAAMGAWCPFFEAAGMRAYALPIARRHARLIDALDSVGIAPWELADPARVLAHIRRRGDASAALLAGELATWANASRATRAMKRWTLRELLEAASRAAVGGLGSPVVGYAHTSAVAKRVAA